MEVLVLTIGPLHSNHAVVFCIQRIYDSGYSYYAVDTNLVSFLEEALAAGRGVFHPLRLGRFRLPLVGHGLDPLQNLAADADFQLGDACDHVAGRQSFRVFVQHGFDNRFHSFSFTT
jgi:hypothetical protein